VAAPPDFSKQHDILTGVEKALGNAEQPLKDIVTLASNPGGCPGSGGGIPIPHGGDMAAKSGTVLGAVGVARNDVNAVINSLPVKP
jgi:hypothetical protein